MSEPDRVLSTQFKLEQWARWRDYQTGEVKGYPREVPFYRLMRGTAVSAPMITDSLGERVDYAVTRLCARCPDQGQAIKLRYLDGHNPGRIGREMKTGETKARELLRAGESAIEWILDCT
jgi:hypothetical protein